MRPVFFTFLLLFFLLNQSVHTDIKSLKDDIAFFEKILAYQSETTFDTKSMVKLAICYVKDQEVEKGVKLFIETLKYIQIRNPPSVSSTEQELYQKALNDYINRKEGKENARYILTKYGPIVKEHPDYYLLNYLVAAAYANLGIIDQFFDTFIQSYQYYPDNYISYKTQAVLYSILYGKTAEKEEKERLRQSIEVYIRKALKHCHNDSGLYKMLITYCSSSEKKAVIQETIKNILSSEVIIPRSEILFFVREALKVQEKDHAREFVRKAKKWYDYSRHLKEAEQLVGDRT
ncbi:MAG: hypothetical protein Tsb0021_04180 [Chlamydiales bacterium]